MGDDLSSKEVLSHKKSSIDDIIDHITADLQSYDGRYILLGQPSNSETQSIWQQRVTRQPENLNYVQNNFQESPQRTNFYYPNNSFVDNSRSNYVSCMYGNSNQYQPSNGEAPYNYIYYHPNSNPPNQDYGLFSQAPSNFQNHHVIENLVGNWVPNQNGTYSQFGNTSHMMENRVDANIALQHQSQPSQHSTNSAFSKLPTNTVRKPRMVAEVRPMRPSYSDVLAKSVTQVQSAALNGSSVKSSIGVKIETNRAKPLKNKKNNSMTKNGGPVLKRQLSSGSEEQMLNSVKANADKRITPTKENHNWSSIEDLSKNSPYSEFEKENPTDRSPLANLNNKKSNTRKTKTTRQNEESHDTKKTCNNQAESRKTQKKNATPVNFSNNIQWGVGKQTSPVRNEKKTTKNNVTVEVKKSSSTAKNLNQSVDSMIDNSKSAISSKISARFGNVPVNQRKLQRITKRREGTSKLALIWKRWRDKFSCYVMQFFTWLLYLLWDVLVMSFHLWLYLLGVTINCSGVWFSTMKSLLKNLCTNPRNWWSQGKKNGKTSSSKKLPYSNRSENSAANLTSNISLPQTGDEAMKRLFACKGKDPYSILGVTKNCPDEIIKKYYKRQAVLVHPDKNNQPGAEEAFKILVHAFELIGESERRKAYDRCMMESEEQWEELSNLLSQLHKKMEYAANTIRCTNCGNRHKRSLVERPLYAARFCSQCKIHHSAREGDIWAESSMLGWLWRYYACMDGAVYDISDWAACQADNLRHLKPNTHVVQYRIVVGKHRPNPPPASPQPPPPPPPNCSEQDLEDFLSSLYGHRNGSQSAGDHCNGKFRKKSKKKK